jgi:hypothetical protein
LKPGDRIFLDLRGTRRTFVYVFNEDSRGEIVRLFPLEGVEPANPLKGGRVHELPGHVNGVPQRWTVSSASGKEAILVVASSKALAGLEEAIEALPSARPEETGEGERPGAGGRQPEMAQGGPAAGRGEMKGIGQYAPDSPGSTDVKSELSRLEHLAAAEERAKGRIWFRRFEISTAF